MHGGKSLSGMQSGTFKTGRYSKDLPTRLADIRPQRRNANKHTQRGSRELEHSIQTLGWLGAITVAADGETFDGSDRVNIAGDKFDDAEPIVIHSDGSRLIVHVRDDIPNASDPRAVKAGIAANKIAADNLAWDAEVIAAIALDDDGTLDDVFSGDEIADIVGDLLNDPTDDPGAQVDKAAELQEKWQTERGQLWEIPSEHGGTHRLLCGDSTSAEDVARLMGGERAATVIIDPPYGVTKNEWDRLFTQGELTSVLGMTDGPVVVFNAARPDIVKHMLELTPLCERIVIWRTSSPTIGGGLFWTWQPVYLWRCGGRQGWDSYDWAAKPTTTGEHNTQKPVDFIERIIDIVCSWGDAIMDTYLGSGTTMVAAEQTGRICYGMEIEPKYVAVALERMAGMGLAPNLG